MIGSPHNEQPLGIIPDHSSKLGAQAMAVRLYRYWVGKGYAGARFWVDNIAVGVDCYSIRSNLIRGLPPGIPSVSASQMASLGKRKGI
jgi:hypothetical protein